jgi:hypothetical protein
MSDERDIQADLEIDPNNLEIAAVQHATLLDHYSEEYTKAKDEYRFMELDLNVLTAKKAALIRSKRYPDLGEDFKPTDKSVESILTADEEIVAETRKVLKQKSYVERMGSVVDAFGHRKSMIQKLVDLFIYNYYSDVKPSKLGKSVISTNDPQLKHLANLEQTQ